MVLGQIVGVVEAEMKVGIAHPICADISVLIFTLAGTIGLMLTGDLMLVGRDSGMECCVRLLEQMWLNVLWGG